MRTNALEFDFLKIALEIKAKHPGAGEGRAITFSQFVQFIIDREAAWQPNKTASYRQTEVEKKLLKPKLWHDRHMEPMHSLCSPCQANFKVITKVGPTW